jgi:hypothetical protein
MPQYTFRFDPAPEDRPDHLVQALENDEVAVHVARRMLGPNGRVRVGRGAGEGVEWLGAWEAQSRSASWRDQG